MIATVDGALYFRVSDKRSQMGSIAHDLAYSIPSRMLDLYNYSVRFNSINKTF